MQRFVPLDSGFKCEIVMLALAQSLAVKAVVGGCCVVVDGNANSGLAVILPTVYLGRAESSRI